MSLSLGPAPASTIFDSVEGDALRLLRFSLSGLGESPPVKAASKAALEAASPMLLYRLNCESLLDKGIRGAEHTGWCWFFFKGGEEPIASVRVRRLSAKKAEVMNVQIGEVLKQRLEALKAAEFFDTQHPADYKLRMLEVPGLLFAGIWLWNDHEDFVAPCGKWGRLEPFKVVPARVVEDALKEAAVRQRQAYSESEDDL